MSKLIVSAVILGILLIAWIGSLLMNRRLKSALSAIDVGPPEKFARDLLGDLSDQNEADIYRRFKIEIDAARELFLAKFPTHENVFYMTLVSVAAQGDASRLGSDYPYSRSLAPPI